MKNSHAYDTKQNTYHVIFGVDKNYVKYTAVLMYGIVLQAKNHQLMPLLVNASRGGG
ncbi:hypothetical protein ACRE1U_04790 [Helicobacter himalayensis]|uniref:hypothetical protein n=1 Tax=Helicobacter himalayensis TaxID=1591088 RepID=UPI003D6FEDCE